MIDTEINLIKFRVLWDYHGAVPCFNTFSFFKMEMFVSQATDVSTFPVTSYINRQT